MVYMLVLVVKIRIGTACVHRKGVLCVSVCVSMCVYVCVCMHELEMVQGCVEC